MGGGGHIHSCWRRARVRRAALPCSSPAPPARGAPDCCLTRMHATTGTQTRAHPRTRTQTHTRAGGARTVELPAITVLWCAVRMTSRPSVSPPAACMASSQCLHGNGQAWWAFLRRAICLPPRSLHGQLAVPAWQWTGVVGVLKARVRVSASVRVRV